MARHPMMANERATHEVFWAMDGNDELLIRLFEGTGTPLRILCGLIPGGSRLSSVRRRLGELREMGRVGYRQLPVRGTPKRPGLMTEGSWPLTHHRDGRQGTRGRRSLTASATPLGRWAWRHPHYTIRGAWPVSLDMCRLAAHEHYRTTREYALEGRVAELVEQAQMGCENPPNNCPCPGCTFAEDMDAADDG